MSRVILIQALPRDPATGGTVAVHLAGGGSRAYTHLGVQDWLDGVVAEPRFTSLIGFDATGWTGAAIPQTGALGFAPSSPRTLARLAALVWPSAEILVLAGDDDAAAPAWQTLLHGYVAGLSTGNGVMSLTTSDLSAVIAKPLCTSFAGTGGIEGGADAAGRVKRRSWGRVFNVEGRLIDAATNVYEFGDPARPLQQFVSVRDRGRGEPATAVAWQGSIDATLAALKNAAAPNGGAAVAPSIACAKWWTQPSGPLTADLLGEIGTGYVETAPAIAAAVVAAMSTVPVVGVAAVAAIRPAPAGLHVDSAAETGAQALDRVLFGASLAWSMSPQGAVQMLPIGFDNPVEIVDFDSVERAESYPPVLGVKISYALNNRVQSDGEISAAVLAGDISGLGPLAVAPSINFGSPFLLESANGASASLANFKTALGVSSAIAGQGAFATLNTAAYGSPLLTGFGGLAPLSSVGFGSPYLLEGAGGVQATLDAFKTALGIAGGFLGQGSLATLSSLAYGSNYLTGFGALAPLASIAFGSGFLKTGSGSIATDALYQTFLGTAAAIAGQAATATSSDFSVITGATRPADGATSDIVAFTPNGSRLPTQRGNTLIGNSRGTWEGSAFSRVGYAGGARVRALLTAGTMMGLSGYPDLQDAGQTYRWISFAVYRHKDRAAWQVYANGNFVADLGESFTDSTVFEWVYDGSTGTRLYADGSATPLYTFPGAVNGPLYAAAVFYTTGAVSQIVFGPYADVTAQRTAAGVFGQSDWATFSSVPAQTMANRTQNLGGDGSLPGYALFHNGVRLSDVFPAQFGADRTSLQTAAGIAGQTEWATYTGITTNVMAGRVQYLQNDGKIESAAVYKYGAGSLSAYFPATTAADRTGGATAAAIAGQSDWATYAGVPAQTMANRTQNLDPSGNLPGSATFTNGVRLSDVYPAQYGADRTGSQTAAAITGQTGWATYTGITTTLMQSKVQNLQSDGYIESGTVYKANVGFLSAYFPVTTGADRTGGATAAAIAGQSDWATYSGITTGAMASRVQYLQNDGKLESAAVYKYGAGSLSEYFPATTGADRTGSATAAGIAGQGIFATAPTIGGGNVASYFAFSAFQLNYSITRADGASIVTESLAITALGIASAIAGQGKGATSNKLSDLDPGAAAQIANAAAAQTTIKIGIGNSGVITRAIPAGGQVMVSALLRVTTSGASGTVRLSIRAALGGQSFNEIAADSGPLTSSEPVGLAASTTFANNSGVTKVYDFQAVATAPSGALNDATSSFLTA